MPSVIDVELLEAALIGLQHEGSEIDRRMAEIRARIGRTDGHSLSETTKPIRKRVLSAASRRRIVAAQRKRWAAFHKEEKTAVPEEKAAPTKFAAKKRKMSPAAKKRIGEATKKRWEAFRVAKATATRRAASANATARTRSHPTAKKARKAVGKKSVVSQVTQIDVLPVEQTT